MDYKEYVVEIAQKSKYASRKLAKMSTDEKNKVLLNIAAALRSEKDEIIKANEEDISRAKKAGVSSALIDRLLLTEQRIEDMAKGVEQVVMLPDPCGETIRAFKNEAGLKISQVRVPLGVIAIIYEARPNVTVDAAALCLKSGNACILRGGSEAINSNIKIVEIMQRAVENSGLLKESISLIELTSREVTNELMKLNQYVDVLIPRGGAGLINFVIQNSTVPVIETGVGNCHVYVDESADFSMAINIIINAKTQRPAVCNALEKVLVHESIAKRFLPLLAKELQEKKVEIRGCSKTKEIISCKDAISEDWDIEYLDLIIGIKVVKDISEAIEHIYTHGTKHSESIITENYSNAQRFLDEVDAAAVYVNASTRFTDGGQFGFGAEIGISTQKLHARGPMGLKELTSSKYIVYGDGQIRK